MKSRMESEIIHFSIQPLAYKRTYVNKMKLQCRLFLPVSVVVAGVLKLGSNEFRRSCSTAGVSITTYVFIELSEFIVRTSDAKRERTFNRKQKIEIVYFEDRTVFSSTLQTI